MGERSMNALRLKTRTKIIVVLIAVLVATHVWQTETSAREPTLVEYCLKYHGTLPNVTCADAKRLSVPAAFGDIKVTDSWHPHGNAKVDDSWYRIELAYPTMQPWRTVPWLDRDKTQKLEINLRGLTSQTVQDVFGTYFLGTPKPVRLPSIYGMDQYVWEVWGKTQLLLPIEASPRLVLACARDDDPNDLRGENPHACTTTTYTNWQLKVAYSHRRALIPEWQTVHAKVHAFIESLVVTP